MDKVAVMMYATGFNSGIHSGARGAKHQRAREHLQLEEPGEYVGWTRPAEDSAAQYISAIFGWRGLLLCSQGNKVAKV